jgi:crossover junction endodeoxyribonuclease RuvC
VIALAIDIGLTGALAAVNSYGAAQVMDLPTLPAGKTRRIDGRGLIVALRSLCPPDGSQAMLLIEDIQARPLGNGGAHGNTMHSQGSIMRSRGIVEAVADIARIELQTVHPQTWKRHFGLLGKDKDAGRQLALTLYPSLAADLKLKKHHNRADAVLLAHWLQGERA